MFTFFVVDNVCIYNIFLFLLFLTVYFDLYGLFSGMKTFNENASNRIELDDYGFLSSHSMFIKIETMQSINLVPDIFFTSLHEQLFLKLQKNGSLYI